MLFYWALVALLAGSYGLRQQFCRLVNDDGNLVFERRCRDAGSNCTVGPEVIHVRGGAHHAFRCSEGVSQMRSVEEGACKIIRGEEEITLDDNRCRGGQSCTVGPLYSSNPNDTATYFMCGGSRPLSATPCMILTRENRTVVYQAECRRDTIECNLGPRNWSIEGEPYDAYFCNRFNRDPSELRDEDGKAGRRRQHGEEDVDSPENLEEDDNTREKEEDDEDREREPRGPKWRRRGRGRKRDRSGRRQNIRAPRTTPKTPKAPV